MLLELLNRFNVKATIFVIADMLDHYPKVIDLLKNAEHEIACHGLSHEVPIHTKTKKIIQDPEKWEQELIDAKGKIENIFSTEVIGYRAPGAYFAGWMVPLLVKNGFKYDSSIAYNSFFNKTNIKLNGIPSNPYWIDEKTLGHKKAESGNALLEIPWSNLKLGKIVLPGGGAFFFRVFGLNYFKYLLNQNLKQGDTVFYIHAIDISREKFPLSFSKKRPFYWINKGKKTEKKLIRLLELFKDRFTNCKRIYEKNLAEDEIV